MKKKKDVLLMILATVVVMLAMSVNVWAAQKNPLAKMPTKMKVTLGCSVDNVTNYSTPVYYNRENIEISAVSSNPKVMMVFSRVSGSDGGAKRNAFYQVTGIKEGTAKVNVTVKVNGKTYKKTYKKTCTYTFVKYANPFKTLKIGKKNLASYYAKEPEPSLYGVVSRLSGKLTYSLKAGYKVEKIEYSRFVSANNGSIKMYSIKKGQKLPKDFMALVIKLKNTKNNAYVSIRVDNN